MFNQRETLTAAGYISHSTQVKRNLLRTRQNQPTATVCQEPTHTLMGEEAMTQQHACTLKVLQQPTYSTSCAQQTWAGLLFPLAAVNAARPASGSGQLPSLGHPWLTIPALKHEWRARPTPHRA
jgi:hypothetical protein